jgi:hypothetical protein
MLRLVAILHHRILLSSLPVDHITPTAANATTEPTASSHTSLHAGCMVPWTNPCRPYSDFNASPVMHIHAAARCHPSPSNTVVQPPCRPYHPTAADATTEPTASSHTSIHAGCMVPWTTPHRTCTACKHTTQECNTTQAHRRTRAQQHNTTKVPRRTAQHKCTSKQAHCTAQHKCTGTR